MDMAQATAAGKGLEGVTATTSAVSSIIGSTLTYRGIDINELAESSSFEETTYLLLRGELPSQQQLDSFSRSLSENRRVPTEVIELIRRFPSGANAMVSLRTAISALAFYDPQAQDMSAEANQQKGVRLIAQFPTIVAAIDRIRHGEEPLEPDPSLNEATDFLRMLKGDAPSDTASRVMDVALILHADHELNASTFAARVAASTLSDMHSAVVAALCTLKGPLHGGANEAVMATLAERSASWDSVTGSTKRVTPERAGSRRCLTNWLRRPAIQSGLRCLQSWKKRSRPTKVCSRTWISIQLRSIPISESPEISSLQFLQ
jgi:citrate synthase